MRHIARAAAAAAILLAAGPSFAESGSSSPEGQSDKLVVTVDRAKVYRLSKPASTIIIGNPAIADATVEDDRTLVLTGRAFGVTNLIVLDANGDPIVDETVVVRGHETNTVRIYRRANRETMACAPVCEPTLTIGDNSEAFNFASEQIQARNTLSERK